MSFSTRVLLNTAGRNLRLITPLKVYNASKVAASYYLSRKLKRPFRWGKPVILMVEPTNSCNLRCPMCPSGNGDMKRPIGMMARELSSNLLDELKDTLFLVMFWNQGEPFLNKSLLDMVSDAHTKRVATVVSTNGHFTRTPNEARTVIQSGLTELIVSLDGATSESYVKYRVGGDFQKVIDGIRLVSEEKKRLRKSNPIIHLQFLLFKHNRHEIARIRQMAYELGADKYSFKTAQVYTDEQAEEFLPDDPTMNRYEKRRGARMLKADWSAGCKRIWFTAMVNWDGSVAPCCYDKDVDYLMGDASSETLSDIWSGETFESFRKRVLLLRPTIDICRNCGEGLKVEQFNRVEWVGKKLNS